MRTMLDYDNLKLRERTFLDFTDDEAIIGEIIGEIIGDKEFFLSHITEENRASTFLEFADLATDKKLSKAIQKEFDGELKSMFCE